jgi:tripartite-type tricarboxylate transporter receptor subunit TctC
MSRCLASPLSRRAGLTLAAAAASTGLARPVTAQGRFPDRSIRMLLPFTPLGPTDLQMRALCDLAAKRLGQAVVLEHRIGAGGILGAQVLAASALPDGYTLAQMPITVLRVPLLSGRPPFDPLTDFSWIIQLSGYLFGVVVRADAPWQSFRAFLDDAKARRGKIIYGTPGAATTPHVVMEQIAARADIAWVQVPFRGTSENLEALLAGRLDAAVDASGWAPQVQGGRLRLLCTWGAVRAKRFPDTPTLREVGFDIVATSPYGIAGPKGMTEGVVRVLHDAFKDALYDPAHVAVLDRFDMQIAYLNSEDYATAVRRQYDEERERVRHLGLRPS